MLFLLEKEGIGGKEKKEKLEHFLLTMIEDLFREWSQKVRRRGKRKERKVSLASEEEKQPLKN